MLKLIASKAHDGSQRITVDHDDFRHTVVMENNKPIYLSIFYKGKYISVALDPAENIVNLEHQEELLKKNWDFI